MLILTNNPALSQIGALIRIKAKRNHITILTRREFRRRDVFLTGLTGWVWPIPRVYTVAMGPGPEEGVARSPYPAPVASHQVWPNQVLINLLYLFAFLTRCIAIGIWPEDSSSVWKVKQWKWNNDWPHLLHSIQTWSVDATATPWALTVSATDTLWPFTPPRGQAEERERTA